LRRTLRVPPLQQERRANVVPNGCSIVAILEAPAPLVGSGIIDSESVLNPAASSPTRRSVTTGDNGRGVVRLNGNR